MARDRRAIVRFPGERTMIAFITLLCCAFQAQAAKADVTPVEKVIQMIRDLQTQARSLHEIPS